MESMRMCTALSATASWRAMVVLPTPGNPPGTTSAGGYGDRCASVTNAETGKDCGDIRLVCLDELDVDRRGPVGDTWQDARCEKPVGETGGDERDRELRVLARSDFRISKRSC